MRDEIEQYYLNDKNSSLCSGTKECITVKVKDGPPITIQKRVMLYDLKDLYSNFIKDTAHEKVPCLAFFCQLKPQQCFFPGEPGTHNICVCPDHQNVKLKLAALNPDIYYKDVIEASVCSMDEKDCMLHSCEECPAYNNNIDPIVQFISNGIDIDRTGNIKYSIWTTVSVPSKSNPDISSISRISLVEFDEPFEKVLKSTAQDIYDMTPHHFIAIKQKEFYNLCREQLDYDSGVLCMDFAENYTPIAQNSPQGLYFNNETITLFTAVLYYKSTSTNEIQCQSYCVISESSIHQAYSVHIFLETIIIDIKTAYPAISSLTEFSDGAPSQFKNK